MKTKIEFLNNYLNNGGRKDSIYSIASLLSTGDGHKRDNISNIANSEGWSILKKKKKKNIVVHSHIIHIVNYYATLIYGKGVTITFYITIYILKTQVHVQNENN